MNDHANEKKSELVSIANALNPQNTETSAREMNQGSHGEAALGYTLDILDRINRTLSSQGDLKEMLRHLLDEMLSIFGTDRA